MTPLGITRQRGPVTLYMHPATYNAVPMECFVGLRSASVIVDSACECVALTIADAFELECFAAAIEPAPTSATPPV